MFSRPSWYATVIFSSFLFFFNDTAPTEIYTLSLHDALPICEASTSRRPRSRSIPPNPASASRSASLRSEEHTSELQSRRDLVCRLLLEKKKKTHQHARSSTQQLQTLINTIAPQPRHYSTVYP